MDSLSQLLALLAPRCVVNLHCRFGGQWAADQRQQAPGVVPWHVILRGEAQLHIAEQTVRVRAGDILMLPHGSPHLLQSLVEWGQVVPALKQHNGILTEVRTDGPGPVVEVLCGEFHFGPNYVWLFADETELIHLETDERQDCDELNILLRMLIRESFGGAPGRCDYRQRSGRYTPGACSAYFTVITSAARRVIASDE